MSELVVVGSINIDFVARVARLPRAGETVAGDDFQRHFGGKGANQAVAAARLGAQVRLIGAVGADDLGAAALADLRSEGIDVAGVQQLVDAKTGVALIVVDHAGQNQIAVASGANASVNGEKVTGALAGWERPDEQAVVLLVFEVGDDPLLAAARYAGEHGLRLIVNPAPARAMPVELIRAHPIVIANEGEADTLVGRGDARAAASAIAELTGAPAIVTLGADGALIADGRTVSHLPTPAVLAVDTTGAGDAFVGAFAAELASGVGVEPAVRFALVAASISITKAGARGGMPNRVLVEDTIGARQAAAYPTLGDEE